MVPFWSPIIIRDLTCRVPKHVATISITLILMIIILATITTLSNFLLLLRLVGLCCVPAHYQSWFSTEFSQLLKRWLVNKNSEGTAPAGSQ